METLGKLDCVITQNIDGLHFKAGNSKKGDPASRIGHACHLPGLWKEIDRDEIQERLKKGLKVPYCDDCKGPLKPATISFGQSMPREKHRKLIIDLHSVIFHRDYRPWLFSLRLPCLWSQKKWCEIGHY
jgi:NAD-dependent SIR2 family protein deacetylase